MTVVFIVTSDLTVVTIVRIKSKILCIDLQRDEA